MSIAEIDGTIPVQDDDSRAYWQALRAHRIVLQRCAACARHRFPRMPGCPYCGVLGGEDVEVDGSGTVYSFVRVHTPLSERTRDMVPYTVAVVDLDAGPRAFGLLDGGASGDLIGTRVHASFADHPAWTELRFALAAAEPVS